MKKQQAVNETYAVYNILKGGFSMTLTTNVA